ncbi:Denticleless protein [Galdieria sulphuraria]|nr:Denticleless protein [Galdieria sulphuraria]
MLWDTRCPAKSTFLGQNYAISPVLSLQQVHSPSYASPLQDRVTKRRRTSSALDMRPQNEASTSYGVTGMAFHPQSDGHLLFTSGAVDGSVKLWDIRKISSTSKEVEFLAVCHPGCDEELTSRPHGISSIQMDSNGRYLLACSTDSRVYLYDPSRIEWGACTILTGGQNMSFYVKCDFSPDGNFVVTGSCNSKAYIWYLGQNRSTESCLYPFLELEGHQGEVSDVAWCRTEPELIATSGDDCMVSLWQGPRLRQMMKTSSCVTNSPINATRLYWADSVKVDTPSRKRQRREGDDSRTPLQLKSITEYFNRVSPCSSETKEYK